MSPGDKIKTIKLVAKKLAELNDWAEIDLTLRTFGFPWSDDWNGSGDDAMYRYCMHHLEVDDDSKLLSIQQYVLGENQQATEELNIREVLGPWQPQRFKLFMSHVTADKKFVGEIKTRLASFGIDSFVAHEDIRPTKEWANEILLALDTCDALAAFITDGYHGSDWTDQEVGYAIKRKLLIIPLGFGVTPYGFMGKYQSQQCKDLDADALSDKIFDILLSHEKTRQKLTDGLLGLFEDSSNFSEAIERARLLQSVQGWTSEQLKRMQDAKERNKQIGGSVYAAPIVEKIISDNRFD